MLDQILVPLDQSVLAECVLPHVVALARSFAASVKLLHVVEACPGPNEPLEWHLRKVQGQAYLNEVSARLSSRNMMAETVLLDGPAAKQIVDYARSHGIELVALSSHGQSGLSDWNISSVVQKVIARVSCSVLIVPVYRCLDPSTDIRYQRILLPLDGSTRAGCVLPVASSLAQAYDAELILTHVVARPEMPRVLSITDDDRRLGDELVQRNRAAIEAYFESLRGRLTVKSRTQVRIGEHVATELQQITQAEGVDLVLLSAHGYSGQRAPYGGVAASFIACGRTPLLIIQDLPKKEIETTQAEMALPQERAPQITERYSTNLQW